MFIFAYANGTLEAVANPLVATLFPHNRTHYLNILHATWPAGLVLGSVAGWILDDKMQLDWKTQLALYLIPTVVYGLMFLGQKMPKSEASKKGLSLGEMFKDVGILGAGVAACLWRCSSATMCCRRCCRTAYPVPWRWVDSRWLMRRWVESRLAVFCCLLSQS